MIETIRHYTVYTNGVLYWQCRICKAVIHSKDLKQDSIGLYHEFNPMTIQYSNWRNRK